MPTPEQRIVRRAAAWFLGGVALAWVLALAFGPALVEAVYDGRLLPHLSRLLRHAALNEEGLTGLAAVQARILAILVRLTAVGLLAAGSVVALSMLRPHLFRDALRGYDHPLNPAVLRVIAFTALGASVDVDAVVALGALPAELRVAPPGLELVAGALPTGAPLVRGAHTVFVASCALAALGWGARLAGAVAVVLGVYLLGIPQLFGKINHYHFLIWFAALAAAAPASDVLSIRAARQTVSRWRAGALPRPARPDRAYAAPVYVGWALLAIVYVFPGLWKLVIGGPAWVLSDNVKYKMYAKWMEVDGWLPAFPIDAYPWLYKLGAFATIGFELLFPLFLLTPALRVAAGALGIAFHLSTRAFMRIWSWPLQAFYVVLVDWPPLLARLGRRLSPRIVVRPGRGFASAIAVAASAVDVLDRVRYGPPAGPALVVERDGRAHTGARAFGVLVRAAPLALPTLPALAVGVLASHVRPTPASLPVPRRRPALMVGSVLVAGNLLCGVTLLDSWPFGVFPTFASLAGPEMQTVEVELRTAGGRLLDEADLARAGDATALPPARMKGLLYSALTAPDETERERRLALVWSTWRMSGAPVDSVDQVRFYRTSVRLDPRAPQPARRDRSLLYTLIPEAAPSTSR